MRLTIIILAAALLIPAAWSQSIYVGAGPAVYAGVGAPHTAVDLTVAVGDDSGTNASYTTLEARGPNIKDPSQITWGLRTGYRRVLARTGNVDLFTLVLGGVSATSTVLAGAFSGGGGVTWNPKLKRASGLRFTVTGQALGTAAGVGWEPLITAQVGYVFKRI